MADIKQIQFKRTSEAGKKPTPESLAEGELAINLADRTLFTKSGDEVIDLGFAKGGTVDGDINQIKGNITTAGDLTAKNGNFDYTVRIERSGGKNPGKMLAIQSDGTSTNDMLIQHWGAGVRESILEFKFDTSASHPTTKTGMFLQRATDDTVSFSVNGQANIGTHVTAGTYVRAGGENGMVITAFTGNAAPTRSFQIGNFASATYENAIQFTDGSTWLGELGTRKAIRPNNQTKSELKINGCITTLGNSESYRINQGQYGTFWRHDGSSLYLMQTAKGDADGTFSALRPFRLNLESGDVSIHTTTIQNQPGKNWVGIGTPVTTNADQLGVAGLGTFVAVGDSDTGIGQRGDGNLDLLANNVAVLKLTGSRVLTTRAFTAQVQDSTGKIVMPANNNAILTVDGSGEPNQATNGVTLLCYNSGDKYHHYFRGNGNFVVNMPYASFDKDIYAGGFINAAYIHSRGSINTTTVPQGTYKWDDLSTSANNGAKSLLRRFRSQGNESIFHETVQGGNVQISTGLNAGQMPLWGYNNNAFILNKQLFFPAGTASSKYDSSLKAWGDGNARQVVLEFGDAVGYYFYAQRHSTAGVQLQVNGTLTTSSTITAANLASTNNITASVDIIAARHIRANGSLYWGTAGAWAASDGNIYGTQWGEGGTLAWMGSNVAKLWGNQTFRAAVIAKELYANGNSVYVQGNGNRHVWFRNAAGAEKGLIYNDDNGHITVRTNGASGNKNWVFEQSGSFSSPGNITSAAWMYALEFYLNSDRRLKTSIVPMESSLDKLHKIGIKRYAMKDGSNGNAIGVIAQEVQDVFPELVSEKEDGMLTVNYRGLSTVLWKIVQEQDVKLQSIEDRLAKLGV